jgi:flavorubredoxin
MFVSKAIELVQNLEIKMVAPSHGIIWRENPAEIIEAYSRFARYMTGPAEPEVTILWSSMYGNTQKVVSAMVKGVRSEGLPVHLHRVPDEHVSFILASAWKSAGLIIGMPTYEYRMFPPMAWALDMFGRKKVWNKKVLRFGSFGWSGGAQREFEVLTEKMKWTFVEPVEWAGCPDDVILARAEAQAVSLARQIKADLAG